jgi:hypothetical protein
MSPTPSSGPAAEAPPPCLDAKLVWADALEQLLLVGCVDQSTETDIPGQRYEDRPESVWAWDPAAGAWELLAADGPIGNVVSGMGWDGERDVLVRYGGIPLPDQSCEPATWEWDGTTWVELEVEPPPACDHIELAPDTATGRLLLVGGGEAQTLMSGTWGWDGAAWSQRVEEGPAPRAHHGFATDAEAGRTLLYAGLDNTHLFDDLWSWDGSAWEEIVVDGVTPGTRSHHAFAVGASGALLVGGATSSDTYGSLVDDAWLFADGAWTQLEGDGPSARGLAALGYDPVREVFVLHGGFDGDGTALDDTWEWDGTWSCVAGC